LCWLLGLGKPTVAVAITLDLSSSTYYGQDFNAPSTVMAQEVVAVNAYLDANNSLRNANKVQIFGFGGQKVVSLTKSFETDSKKVQAELMQSMQDPQLPPSLQPEPERDDLNAPLLQGIQALSNLPACREVLMVSDSGVTVSPSSMIPEARKHNVRINSITFDGGTSDLQQVVHETRGLYIAGEAANLPILFTQRFFPRFNSNLRWLVLFLGAAWIALMWFLTLPLDQWIFQGLLKFPMHTAGQLAIGNAFFWSGLTPLIVWQLWQFFGLPWFTAC
jgi:Ca-activated chloride channel homolog